MKGFCRANEKLWFLFIFLLLIDGGHSALQKPLPKTSHDIGEELQAGTCESYFTGQRLLTHLMEFKAYKCTCCRKILQSRFFSHFKLLLNEIEGFLVRQRHIQPSVFRMDTLNLFYSLYFFQNEILQSLQKSVIALQKSSCFDGELLNPSLRTTIYRRSKH